MLVQNWMLVAFIAPALWALVILADRIFGKIFFADEAEAAGVIGMLGIMPIVSIFYFGVPQIGLETFGLAISGGILFTICTFYCFRSLFVSGDATLVAVLLNVSGLTVPLFATVLLKEALAPIQYVAILIIVVVSIRLGLRNSVLENNLKHIIVPMAIAVVTVSLSMVLEGEVYRLVGFRNGFVCFSFGVFLGGVFFSTRAFLWKGKAFRLSPSDWLRLLLIEGTNLFAAVASQYAISIGPSVSFVATIETTQPAFVLLFSLIALGCCKLFGGSQDNVSMFRGQLAGFRGKFFTIVLMVIGVYILGLK
ncbi:MAG: hypothetical protein WCJ25_01240 [Candidatus Moraniibacteriota bacterium]